MILYLNLDGMSEKEAFKAIDEFIPRVAKRAILKQRSVEMSDNILTHERFSGAPVIAEEIEAKSLSGPSEWLLRTSASSADALSADFRKNHATNWRAQGCCIAVESRPFNSSN